MYNIFASALKEHQRGNLQRAIKEYQDILGEEPQHLGALTNLAMIWHVLHRSKDAEQTLRHALAIHPHHIEALNGLGVVLSAQKRFEEAAQAYRTCVSRDPTHDLAWHNLGLAYSRLEEMEQAVAAFEQALTLAPDRADTLTQFIFHKLQTASWDELLDQAIARLRTMIHRDASDIDPYLLVFICRSPAELQKAARNHSRRLLATVTPLPPTPSVQRQRVHIGYLSADFHQHATSALAAELFESHDRNQFQISAYSVGPEDYSPMRDRLYHAFDHFCDGSSLTDEALAQKIRQDGIDILVDLKGYTRDARPRVLAMRPAPLQINYLGFPGTMGASFMDYIVADAIVLPPEHEPFFDEHPIRLPHGYQVNDSHRFIDPQPLSRRQAGLPDQGMVFCCFNQSAKITPELLALWLRLLKQIPESILWLLAFHPYAMKRLHTMAASGGIKPQRLIFAPRLPLAQHLARYRLADLFLDSLPCGAHTTASDALWGGCPVLTCMGSTFPGRVAASLLIHLGFPQLVTANLKDYERMAITLAQDHQQRQQIRHYLHQRIPSSPIFNGRIFARHLERGFLEAWTRHVQHQPPAPIHIQASLAESSKYP
ncbi:MAG: tetratricopeptide repeat protein [Magnetococcales bacterium]|nr:tetratricopeptide repeat protein [Magnetococcales bacterium]HIJ85945.1 tetratricopeptide repeat protein [Magnetococcales bacterium]